MTDLFRGISRVVAGKLPDLDKDKFARALSRAHGRCVLIVRRVEEFRSTAQNAYYWGVIVPTLLEHPLFREWSEEQLHDGIKEKFLARLDPLTALTKAGSTRELSPQEFSAFKDAIQQWAAEKLDLDIPDPNEELRKELAA